MSSTTPSEVSPLGSGEIAAILEACSQAGVSVLKFGSLYVRFGAREPQPTAFSGNPPLESDSTPPAAPPEAEISDQPEKVEADALQDEVREVERLEMEMLGLMDPALLEQKILKGDVELNGEEDTEEA